MSFLTRFSLKNVSAVLILCALVVFGGIYSTTLLKKETMPDMNIPIISVITVYPGASPNDIQEKITKPLESLVSSVNGIKSVNSTSSDNVSSIIVQFDYSSNMDEMQRKIQDSIKSAKLPDNITAPSVARINVGSMPILSLSISNNKLLTTDLEQKVRESIIPELSGISGVGQVQLASETQKAVNVKLIPSKLKEYNLTSQTVSQMLQANNVSFPAGSISLNNTVEPIRITGKFNSLDELKNMQLPVMATLSPAAMSPTALSPAALASLKPKIVTLGDIAEITSGTDNATSFSRTNGNPSVILKIIKTQDSNTVDVSDAVKKKLDSMKGSLPEGTEVNTIIDQAVSVNQSINGILTEGLLGAFFAFLVILLFLRNFRTTIIACVSIPLSVLITLIFLKQFNITLNILTLGGLSVAIGRIVDDSIVVIENIYRHLQSEELKTVELIKLGAKEVTSAITSSTLTSVAVFVPIALVSGLAGVMFKPFAITVGIALLSSLLVAVTVIPMMSKLLLLNAKSVKHSDFHEGKLMKGYQRLLTSCLNHKAIVLLIAFMLLIGSFSLVPFIGTSFVPQEQENYINISMAYPGGTDVKVSNEKALEIEKLLAKDNDVQSYQTTVGTSTADPMAMMMGGGGSDSIMIQLKKTSKVDEVIKRLKDEMLPNAGKATFDISQTNPNTGGSGSTNNIEVQITGSDFEKIKESTKILTKELASVQGLDKVSNNISESKLEIAINVDQKKASEKSLSAAQVGMAVRELLNDNSVTTMVVDKNTMEVRLGLKLDSINKLEDIKSIELVSPTGGAVRISDVAEVTEVPGPVSIFTIDGQEYAKVTGIITEKNTGAVTSRVQTKIDGISLPEGVKTQMGGVSQMMGDTFTQLGVAMVAAVAAVFFVMLIALGELVAPLAILFSLPLAAIGGLIALFITRVQLDMPAMIGALLLIGIVVTNAIVLIDRVQHKRMEGISIREALMEAGKIRMRPILMTAIATIAALMPLAFGISKGSLMSQSLAVIVIGGLATSTLLTLIIVPVAYEMLQNLKTRILGRNDDIEISNGKLPIIEDIEISIGQKLTDLGAHETVCTVVSTFESVERKELVRQLKDNGANADFYNDYSLTELEELKWLFEKNLAMVTARDQIVRVVQTSFTGGK